MMGGPVYRTLWKDGEVVENIGLETFAAVSLLGPVDASTVVPWPVMGSASRCDDDLCEISLQGGSKHDHRETYEDGSTYEGQLLDGKRHGQGLWQSVDESYEGQWREDQRHGEGRQTWEDSRLYKGQFREGKFHGRGRMEWRTPAGLVVYEGQYANDLKHGVGRYAWPDGRIYDGEWSEGARWGAATFINPLGQQRKGIWKADKLERWVEMEAGRGSSINI